MTIETFHSVLIFFQNSISFGGVLVIVTGVLMAIGRSLYSSFSILAYGRAPYTIDQIRISLGRVLLLGLEFIIAADLLRTISAADYYALGIVAIIILIRTFLSYTLEREIKKTDEVDKRDLDGER